MDVLSKKDIRRCLDLLGEMYPDAGCELEFENTFQLVCAVSLSAQTTDRRVNEVTRVLFDKCRCPADIADMDIQELEELVHPLGMYKNKAKNLKAMCQTLVSEYGGQVPGEYEALTGLPGVGRKTANVVMSVGFDVPRIAVDTHVFRVANRIGLCHESNELKTELALMEAIPEKEWTDNHHRLIWHGRRCCAARGPKCDECRLNELCLYFRNRE